MIPRCYSPRARNRSVFLASELDMLGPNEFPIRLRFAHRIIATSFRPQIPALSCHHESGVSHEGGQDEFYAVVQLILRGALGWGPASIKRPWRAGLNLISYSSQSHFQTYLILSKSKLPTLGTLQASPVLSQSSFIHSSFYHYGFHR
jgi:hypothetical protein